MTTSAYANNAWYDGAGNWIHQHTRNFNSYNEINESTVIYWTYEYARQDWHDRTTLNFWQSGSHSGNIIHADDGWFGLTGWAGLASSAYHTTHSHVIYNLNYLGNNTYSRAVACQEIGHVAGLQHASGDCMGAGYFSSWSAYPETHSIEMIGWWYPLTGH